MKRIRWKLVGNKYICEECGKVFDKPTKDIFAINWQKVDVCPKCKSPRIKNY